MRNYRLVVRKHELIDYQQREFFAISHNFYEQDKIYDNHWHNSIELTYVVQGKKIQVTKGKENESVEATAGTLLLVNSGMTHRIDVKKGLEGIVLLIDRHTIDYFYPHCTDHHFNLDKDIKAKEKIIEYMILLAKAKDHDDKIRQYIYTLEIIALLAENLVDYDHLYREKHDETSELMTAIMEFIDYNFQDRLH